MELNSARSKTMVWASLVSDYEVLMTNFLASGRWNYESFSSIMKQFHTSSVYHAAVGKGKNRGQHYDIVVGLILNTAKEFWLSGSAPLRVILKEAMSVATATASYPFSCAVGQGTEPGMRTEVAKAIISGFDTTKLTSNDLIVLKKRLGGFYLLYILFFKQPHAFAHLIPMVAKDFQDVDNFEVALQEVFPKDHKNWKAYKFMLNRLILNNAFEPTVMNDKHDLDHPTRFFFNAKHDSHVELLKVLKELQDELTHHQSVRAAKAKMAEYLDVKSELVKNSGGDDGGNGRVLVEKKGETEEPLVTTMTKLRESTTRMVTEMKEAMTKVKRMGDTPVFTRSALLGNETTERLLSSEAGKRKSRIENKETKAASAQRYDRDIFGSQKISNENEEEDKEAKKSTRRGRSQAATNLWSHYIPEQFDFSQHPTPTD